MGTMESMWKPYGSRGEDIIKSKKWETELNVYKKQGKNIQKTGNANGTDGKWKVESTLKQVV